MASIHIRTVDNGFIVSVAGEDYGGAAEKQFVFETAAKAKKLVKQFFDELNAQENGEVLK